MNTRTRWFALVAAMLMASFAFAQETPAAPQARAPQEVVVRIQQDAPTQPKAAPTVVQKANEWAELGTNMGSALGGAAKAILHETKDATFGKDVSLVQGIDNFSKTDAGRFTMLVVGWKVMGKDAIDLVDRFKNVAIGVPFLMAWTVLFIWFWRKNFTAYSVLTSKAGPFWNRTRTYTKVNEDNNWTDAKCGGALISAGVYAASTIAIAIHIIF
jgi:hypothetical protein